MVIWGIQGGRKYPQSAGFVSGTTMIRWAVQGAGAMPAVSTGVPIQRLSVGVSVDLRGGFM